MGLFRFLDWKHDDLVAFLMSGVLGYLVGSSLSAYSWNGYVGVLVGYHIFLGWLLFSSVGQNAPVLSKIGTLSTHLACVTVVLAIASVQTHSIVWLCLRYGIALLAFFEKEWIFSGVVHDRGKREQPVAASTAGDYERWLQMRAEHKHPAFYVGGTPKSDFEAWMKERAKAREMAGSMRG